jgi:ArsR family transcriptional regulator
LGLFTFNAPTPSAKGLTVACAIDIFPFNNIEERPMKRFVRVMKALSDPNRIKILKLLQQKMLCVCEIQAALDVAQPTVSNHLKVLEDAGLVGSRKSGQWVNYHLSDGNENAYAAAMLEKLSSWLDEDPEVRGLLGKLPGIRREDICRR